MTTHTSRHSKLAAARRVCRGLSARCVPSLPCGRCGLRRSVRGGGPPPAKKSHVTVTSKNKCPQPVWEKGPVGGGAPKKE
eukprot:scaffold5574_cov126-Isochrysis_galbana.AAC.6